MPHALDDSEEASEPALHQKLLAALKLVEVRGQPIASSTTSTACTDSALRQERVVTSSAGESPERGDASVWFYTGRAGIAVFLLRLSSFRRLEGDAAGAAEALRRANDEIAASLSSPRGLRGVAFLTGEPGLHAVHAAIAHAGGRAQEAAAAAARVAQFDAAASALPAADCELLYGHAGYLYACLVARYAAGASGALDGAISRTANRILEQGTAAASASASDQLSFTWHGKAYLGFAHGTAGILAVLYQAQSSGAWSPTAEQARRMERAAASLAASLSPAGNLPTRADSSGDANRLVQFCHGASGFLILSASLPASAFANLSAPAAAAAADCVWRRGLLTKGLGLCHGVGGSGYALLAHGIASGERRRSRRRAAAFAGWGCDHLAEMEGRPDSPRSLYEGLAGWGCFLMDVLGPTEGEARMPGAQVPL